MGLDNGRRFVVVFVVAKQHHPDLPSCKLSGLATRGAFLSVHYDGACGPVNPGGVASYGFVVRDRDGKLIHSGYGYVGEGPKMSNNVAEYAAVIAALEYLLDNRLQNHEVKMYGDSNLTVEQMSGRWKIGDGLYREFAVRASVLRSQFERISFHWIPREQNEEADSLSQICQTAPLSRCGVLRD